jgi:hypothetical protein
LAQYFLDTGALVKYYHSEIGTSVISAMFQEPSRKIRISSLGFLEIQSAFAMKVRSGVLEQQGAKMQRARLMLDCNATEHPTAEWTIQQFREFLAFDYPYRFVIHDRDSIFSVAVHAALNGFSVRALKTPVRAPKANAFCERLVGTFRRKCLDFLIPINERHLRKVTAEFVRHYNRGRPHSAFGPGIPEPLQANAPANARRHELPAGHRVVSKPVLDGLHHEYRLEKDAA